MMGRDRRVPHLSPSERRTYGTLFHTASSAMSLCPHPQIRRFLTLCCLIGLWLGWWVGWSSWPRLERWELPWTPDVIVVLGGGDQARSREALRLAGEFPDAPLIVTGDGGTICRELLGSGLSATRLVHEMRATSTVENACFTDALLANLGAQRVVLVTNYFHVPRALAVFRRHQPQREFAAAFEACPDQLSDWHRYCQRRERLAAIHNLLRYWIWSF
jgi:uncharacterized SAM-binding protein YcdF (DUF218 family)